MALCRAHTWPCRGLCRETMPYLMLTSGHNTLPCIAIQTPQQPHVQTATSRYNFHYIVTQSSNHCMPQPRYTPVYCDTNSSVTIQNLYRDTAFPQAKPAFQTTMSQYNFHCIVTQLGSSPTNFCTFSFSFFFSFFTHIYIYIFSSSLLLLETPKNTYPFFFSSFSSTPNKFIKIYFLYFSSVLPTIKPKIK